VVNTNFVFKLKTMLFVNTLTVQRLPKKMFMCKILAKKAVFSSTPLVWPNDATIKKQKKKTLSNIVLTKLKYFQNGIAL